MPMTDHFLTFIPQSVWMAVCHCDRRVLFLCALQFCDSWRPCSKVLRCSSVWKTAWLFVLLFLLHSLFTLVVYVSVSITFSLFLYRSLSAPTTFFSLLLCIFCFVSLPLPSVFPSGILQRLGAGPNQHFCSGWSLHSKVQRPAWGKLPSHTNRTMNTHNGHSPWHTVSEFSTLQAHAVEIGVRCIQCHPLYLMFSCCSCHLCHTELKHYLNVWFFSSSSYLIHSLPMPIPFGHTDCVYLSSLPQECIVCCICPPPPLLLSMTLLWCSIFLSELANL